MVEMRFGETWPRDIFLQADELNPNSSGKDQVKKVQTKDWRNFEVGDRIDIFDVRHILINPLEQ